MLFLKRMESNDKSEIIYEEILKGESVLNEREPKPLGKRLRSIPVMPMRDTVLFPGLTLPLSIERPFNVRLVRELEGTLNPIFLTLQKESGVDLPTAGDLRPVGVLADVIKVLDLPDGQVSALVRVQRIGRLTSATDASESDFMLGNVTRVDDIFPGEEELEETNVAFTTAIHDYRKLIELMDSENGSEMLKAFENIPSPLIRLHFACINSPLDVDDKQQLLECFNIKERVMLFITLINKVRQFVEIREDITRRTHERLTRQQKEHFLRQQINSIEDELGGSIEDEEMNELDAKAEKMKWSEKAAEHFNKEMRKLERFPSNSPEYGIQYTYLENLLNLPWDNYSEDVIDLDLVRRTLDEDHYGLDKVKERIVEQMAVLKLRGDMKAPIICLFGPPGVGKTSLGKSIARAMSREYVRVALGGVHDEAEIRGHRRTYVGAMPGRVIAALEKVGTGNPVFVLDEIDKIASDAKGDPSTALLEVLDPEQNSKFHDNYLNFDYDLSRIMFIATANDLSTISRPLLDRMELIEIPGYVTEEKMHIARLQLLPKVLEEHGLKRDAVSLTDEALVYIIDRYTHESGVRRLQKALAKLVRKLAVKCVDGQQLPGLVDKALVRELMGPETVDPDSCDDHPHTGVVTGLAWTAAGGEILFIEVSLSPGKGKLTLTGQLGDVMKESASIALEYLRAHAANLEIPAGAFDAYDVHIHVPEGAIPKDGPSAGITMLTALASAFTRRKVAPALAMTGEITLSGKVLPVGGIKEKILAAKRAGVTTVLLCEKNRKDIDEIKAEYLCGLEFRYVTHASEVLEAALTADIDPTLPPLKIPARKREVDAGND